MPKPTLSLKPKAPAPKPNVPARPAPRPGGNLNPMAKAKVVAKGREALKK
jgi:hypothetical protein